MKKQIKVVLLSAAATISLAACAGSGFVPASQAPRPYTAAHDIIDGQCRDVNLQATTSNAVDRVLPDHITVVRCPQEAGGVEDAGGVQAANE
ncbi:MAG: hypothetical protein DI586_00900 [Micavibrio aeruginosavorus]|uniref:Lipoprotein n=1 Tax=Micavibrio aeruginosavorus TaxID=349221 RepID=A0A2W5HUF8_9BACT|nr:MAG: hypothetical protein DI586_00900 [Micavibrio aeruginosavorus]